MVSVCLIVTNFNGEAYIPDFCKWLTSTESNFDEILFIDDCSTDASVQLIEELTKHSKLKILQTRINSGRPAEPRNIGLDNTVCDRVVFLDIDDLINPQACCIYRNLKHNIVISGIKTSIFTDISPNILHMIPRFLVDMKNPINLSGSSISRNFFNVCRFENTFLEDWLFWRKIKSKYREARFVYSNNLQIKYNHEFTLSPPKIKQIYRVLTMFGLLGLARYIFGFIFVKLLILKLKLNT